MITKTKNETPARGRLIKTAYFGGVASLLLLSQASGASFFFSTGDPDGKLATLSRPSGPGKMQTETADDFVAPQNVVVTHASFTGLLPSGADLGTIQDVEIELYHVFPGDSVVPPSGNVPNRTNSPADVEITSATRAGANGGLTFSTTLINPTFSVLNSVVNGINKSPQERTGGEGPVTGEEVLITVNFNPPLSLPADRYFFRPEVRLSDGDFLWLSAPRPIVAPGTPLTTDLQSWIRNDALAPDWLRLGTDITGQGPFNAAFALAGETDEDLDGVPDSQDLCGNTPAGAVVDAHGCSLDQIVPCSGPASGGAWKNHGQYVSAFAKAAEEFVAQGLLSGEQASQAVAQAAQSNCGSTSKRDGSFEPVP